ncbi:tyrosine-type recombinase/integrase [Pectobacterium sp. B2J-2]|uniref:tyrosine-type recombinase/integrase n=1 Tax=Pectobacterium sp. B2J-2 TaxID=3385372 RepID=UPI0038FC06CD
MSLTDTKVKNAKPSEKAVKLTDGFGLYLLVHPNGSKYWQLGYRFEGKQKVFSIGVYPAVSLADARQRRDEAKKLLAAGIDPSAKKQEDKLENSGAFSFETIARQWHSTNKKWSADYGAKILRTFETYIFPVIGKRHVAELKTRDLLVPIKAVEDKSYNEVAMRLKQRTTAIMRYAVQQGIIDYNPAQEMSGAVNTGKRQHRPALPFERYHEFLGRVDSYKGRLLTRLAVKLTLLIFIRSSELRFARWSEIDFKKSLWTIPEEREAVKGVKNSHRGAKMKTRHLVPLSQQAVAILKEIQQISGDHDFVFIGDHYADKPMSENTVNKALRTMGYDTRKDVCGHGFRTMACSALIESGLWSKDAVERQMGHQERNNVRAAYIHQAEHLDERRLMLQWWADFLDANREGMVRPFEFAQKG